jgi:hypothetical protein
LNAVDNLLNFKGTALQRCLLLLQPSDTVVDSFHAKVLSSVMMRCPRAFDVANFTQRFTLGGTGEPMQDDVNVT